MGSPYESYEKRRELSSNRWRWYSGSIRFYGTVLLLGAKAADAVTTAIGLEYVPGIVEANPIANAVFATQGTAVGLTVLSFVTVLFTMLMAELLSMELRRQGHHRLGLAAQAALYFIPAVFFGIIAVQNGLLISDLVTAYLGDALTPG